MCSIVNRVEGYGITFEDLEHVVKKRPGRPQGKLSEASIMLIILGVVEEEWRRQRSEPGPHG